jgi:negative regulator of replication initiation
VNRPFVFAIRERTTNTLLFIGQVTDPRSWPNTLAWCISKPNQNLDNVQWANDM